MKRYRTTIQVFTLGVAFAASAGFAAAIEVVPRFYVLDYLATSGEVVDINEVGQVIGERNIDEGCDPFCVIVPSEPGVWDDRGFTPLPMKPDWSWVILEGISNDGWIVGTAYLFDDIRGVVWKPNGPAYDIIEIGNLPDTEFSTVTGIDDQNRVIGYNERWFPAEFKGFVWTEEGGLVDLTTLGFPGTTPMAISNAGTVAYISGWYQLDLPGVVHTNTSPPPGWAGPGPYVAINDFGDQVRLVTDGHEPIYYPFRYNNTGEWQYLGAAGAETSTYASSISNNLDATYTLTNGGWVAEGPIGEGENLGERMAPSYGDASGYDAGPLNESGQMAARLNIGKAPRLVRLVPAERCFADCIRVNVVRFESEFVDDPGDPGRCVGSAHTRSMALLSVTDESGVPLAGVEVTGHFLTEYRHDGEVTATTDAAGKLWLTYTSAPCTGAMTFLVSDAELPVSTVERSRSTFDRTAGLLQQWVIPE